MNWLFWGLTFGVIGKVLFAVAILRVHQVMAKEHRIDKAVIKSFHFEMILTLIGIGLIIAGYFMELYFYGAADFLNESGDDIAHKALLLDSKAQ